MIETLLIIVLVIAIVFDVVRIVQYIRLRKAITKEAKDALFGKIYRLVTAYSKSDEKVFLHEYLEEHWDDDIQG